MIEKWKVLSRWEIFKNRFITLRVDSCELPDGRIMPDYYVLDFVPWVHVLAVTANREAILVRQYRHGAGEVFLEIPGGTMHPDGSEADGLATAQRELLEETGYTSDQWTLLGSHYPNPALQSNEMFIYLAENCELKAKQQLDPFEDIEVELVTVEKLYAMAENGEINHAIVLAGLMMARNKVLKNSASS